MAIKNPSFYTKNKITETAMITDSDSSTTTNLSRLIDGNNERAFFSTSPNSTTFTITLSETINRIALLNTNIADFSITYDLLQDFSTPILVSGSTESNYYFEFNSQAVTSVEITITATQTTGDLIKMGQIYLGTELFEVDSSTIKLDESSLNGFQPIEQDVAQSVTLSDRTVRKISFRQLKQYSIGIAVETQNFNDFKGLKTRNARETFYFIHEPATSPDTFNGDAGNYNLSQNIQIGQKHLLGLRTNPRVIEGNMIQAAS